MRSTMLALILLFFCSASAFAQRIPAGVKAHTDVAYIEQGHERQKLDLYIPKKADKPLPVVIWIHGGAWKAGDKRGCPALPLTRDGYAVASFNYRYSTQAVFPAQIEDCKAAIRFLRKNAKEYNLDTERFGVWGASAGGHLVALLGTSGGMKELDGKDAPYADQSSRVQCVVDWFGPTDFVKIGAVRAESPVFQLFGGTVREKKDAAVAANPITHITKDDPPFLMMQGDEDRTVPLFHSELLHDALKAAGVDSTLVVLKGAAHGGPQFSTDENRKLITEFFEKHLK